MAARAVAAVGQLVCVLTGDGEAVVAVERVPPSGISVVCPPPVPDGDGELQAVRSTSRQQNTATRRISRNDLQDSIYSLCTCVSLEA